MNVKFIALIVGFGVPGLAMPDLAAAQTVQSQDSILANEGVAYGDATGFAMAAHQQIIAAETTVNASAAFMHTQYHENLPEGTGDDENGLSPGFGVGLSGLVPTPPLGADLYTALNYDFSAGDITYGGHYLYSGLPAFATDNTVFNRIELRIGVGLPLVNGMELIPFAAGGYQAWNRNINQKGAIGTDEFYSAGLMGGGIRLDAAVQPRLVLSATAELLALAGGRVEFNSVGGGGNFGITPEERVELAADCDVSGRFHSFLKLYWEHFDYSGSKPSLHTPDFYEPLSTTTQFGANVGVAYSFY
jgi:hypothetical protein